MNGINRRSVLKAGVVTALAAPFAGYLTGASSAAPSLDVSALAGDPAVTGSWTAPFNLGGVAIHATLTHAGHILFFGRRPGGSTMSFVSTWNYTTGALVRAPLPYSRDIFCAGTNVVPDGRVFISGGHTFDRSGAIGVAQTDFWDPTARTWTRRPVLSQARWYPTNVGLPNGRTLVFGGHAAPGSLSNTVDEFDVAANRITRLAASATRAVGLYPRMHLMPNGRIFKAGETRAAAIFNRATSTWTNSASMLFGTRFNGCSVLLAGGTRVLHTGGGPGSGRPPTATAEVIDLTAASPTWRYTAPMATARMLHNAVVLPDGKVFVIGGGAQANYSGPVFTPELFDPVAETWTPMEPHQASRMYHSTALLLPDARVFCAGQDNGPLANYAEIWSPPYLFRGPRPTFTGAPASIGYNQQITLSTPDAAGIGTVTVIKSGSVTHQINPDHRSVPLVFTRNTAAGTLTVTSPPNANIAPPGYYLLFIVTRTGIPSVAPWIRIG